MILSCDIGIYRSQVRKQDQQITRHDHIHSMVTVLDYKKYTMNSVELTIHKGLKIPERYYSQ
jgi:hypothetical protein